MQTWPALSNNFCLRKVLNKGTVISVFHSFHLSELEPRGRHKHILILKREFPNSADLCSGTRHRAGHWPLPPHHLQTVINLFINTQQKACNHAELRQAQLTLILLLHLGEARSGRCGQVRPGPAGPGRLPAAAGVLLSRRGQALAAPCGSGSAVLYDSGTTASAKLPRALRPSGARARPEGKPEQAAPPLRDYTSRGALRRGCALLPGGRAVPRAAVGRIWKEAAAAGEREPGSGRVSERDRGVWAPGSRRQRGRGGCGAVKRCGWFLWRRLLLPAHPAAIPVTREGLWGASSLRWGLQRLGSSRPGLCCGRSRGGCVL